MRQHQVRHWRRSKRGRLFRAGKNLFRRRRHYGLAPTLFRYDPTLVSTVREKVRQEREEDRLFDRPLLKKVDVISDTYGTIKGPKPAFKDLSRLQQMELMFVGSPEGYYFKPRDVAHREEKRVAAGEAKPMGKAKASQAHVEELRADYELAKKKGEMPEWLGEQAKRYGFE